MSAVKLCLSPCVWFLLRLKIDLSCSMKSHVQYQAALMITIAHTGHLLLNRLLGTPCVSLILTSANVLMCFFTCVCDHKPYACASVCAITSNSKCDDNVCLCVCISEKSGSLVDWNSWCYYCVLCGLHTYCVCMSVMWMWVCKKVVAVHHLLHYLHQESHLIAYMYTLY